MKALKLLILFAVIIGGVVLAFWLLEPEAKQLDPAVQNQLVKTYGKQIKDEWSQRADWDKNLFDKQCERIKQWSKKQGFNVTPIKDMVALTPVELIFKNIFAEWDSTGCRKAVVDKYIEAINIIETKFENAKNNPNNQKIKNVNKTYQAAYNLAHSGFGIDPKFDGAAESECWRSFSEYSQGVVNQRNAMLANANYKEYLKNIQSIRNGLAAIPSRLEAAKEPFYVKLAEEIVQYYNDIPAPSRKRSELRKLRQHVSQFEEESNSVNSMLQTLKDEFLSDVETNESM